MVRGVWRFGIGELLTIKEQPRFGCRGLHKQLEVLELPKMCHPSGRLGKIEAYDIGPRWLHVIGFIDEFENIILWVVPCYCCVYSVAAAERQVHSLLIRYLLISFTSSHGPLSSTGVPPHRWPLYCMPI